MARVLRSHEFPSSGWTYYPWERWTDGRIYKAKRKVDFGVPAYTFRMALYRHARNHDMKVRTEHDGNGTVIFQFYDPPKTRNTRK